MKDAIKTTLRSDVYKQITRIPRDFWDRILPFSEADDEANRLVTTMTGVWHWKVIFL